MDWPPGPRRTVVKVVERGGPGRGTAPWNHKKKYKNDRIWSRILAGLLIYRLAIDLR